MFERRLDERVALRLLQIGDKEELFEVVDREREELRRWLPWVDAITSVDDYDGYIRSTLTQLAEGNGFQAAITVEGQIAGMIGVHGVDRANQSTSIGYWLSSAYRGEGIMTRATAEVLRWAFEDEGLERVEVRCGRENLASRKVVERLGLVEEGVLRRAERLVDGWTDLVVYSMLRDAWQGQTQGAQA
ncbi:N-acetyltransferase [Lujinxingia sediminis]|uniref:N-acetyltransferase n=1 Tax=Lujinxingia sediminis TaxID=2480984 RepID=A0ABY0CNP0_9DELT|nr:GNAT family protein [Lujinxingia sediminis]RVU41589.1 N-acetyltransferase [Lujinxingia sediminis]